jgi:hypothetical protein
MYYCTLPRRSGRFSVSMFLQQFNTLIARNRIPPIIFEFLLFALSMISFWRTTREAGNEQNVLVRMHQDGVWAFAIPFSERDPHEIRLCV